MKKIDILGLLYKLPITVFTLKELSLMFPELSYVNLKRRMNNLVKRKKILNLRRGIFVKTEYNKFELACKIYVPSYVSLESVLAKEGIIFQKYDTIFAISHTDREIKVDNHFIKYKRLRDEILLNDFGLEKDNNFFVASKERAFTDAVYIYRNYHFDNLDVLNWDKVFDLSKIYNNKAMLKRIKSYYNLYKENHV